MTRSKSGSSLLFVSSLLLLLILGGPAWAQKDTGSIVGTVKDPSGAIVANAKVTITDLEHGQTSSTTTNAEGEFVVSPLRVGRYTVTVEQSGFKKAVSEPVELNVQDRVAVNITLQIGGINEEMVVTGAAPLLETETSELGQVVDSKRVSNLPLNGRNFAQLALLSTGTAPSEPGARDEGGYGFSANGARSLQNNFLLDGVDNNSNLTDLLNETNFVIQPPVDALQEFKVQTNAYSAEFGRGNGAIVNAVIKSGSNQIHGSAWEFLRNNKLDARNYFDPVGAPAPPYKQNQFGATFGGPIVIPHLYDGRNRSFFFVDYEGFRVRQAQTQVAFVPPTAWRTGDFSSLLGAELFDASNNPILDCNNRPTYAGEIFDAKLAQVNATTSCGVPFQYDNTNKPLNIIPSTPVTPGGGSLDPLALRLAALYPAAGPIGANGLNFVANPVRQETRNNFDVRVDQKFNDRNDTFFRFSFEHQPSFIPGTFGGLADGGGFFSGVEDFSYRSLATSWTHVFRPTVVNEFRLGYNRINAQRSQLNANINVSADPSINFPGVPFVTGIGGLPQMTFSDVATLGSPTFLPSKELQNSYTLSENLTWVRGRHTWKYGTEIRREEFTIFQPASPRGALNFTGTFTDNPAAIGSGGAGFASFMAGLTAGGNLNNLHNVDYFRNTYAFYAQDDWKVTSTLVLNLGLRYELFGTVSERHNDQGTFDLTDPSNPTIIVPKGQTAQLTPFISQYVKISPTGSRGLVNSDLSNFAPRVGLAWQFTRATVLRAGYGIFYGGQENGPYSNPSPGFNPPFFVTQAFVNPCSSPAANPAAGFTDCRVPSMQQLATGFPSNALVDPNTPLFFSVDRNLRTPYMQQWHLGFERQLPGDSVFALTYAGSKGTRLYTFFNGNQAEPTTDSSIPTAPRRPVFATLIGSTTPCSVTNPGGCAPVFDTGIDWFRSTGYSNYNSLQARFEKRFSKGLQFQASYTWGHSLDIASNANLGPTQNNSDFRDFRKPGQEYGNSDFDVRNRFVVNGIYELPFGHGKKFLGGASGVANQVVGGWQIASILALSSGNWYTVLDSQGNFANADGGAGGVSQRPDQISDPNKAGIVAGNPNIQCQYLAGQAIPGSTLLGIAPPKIRTPTAWFNTCAFVNPAQGSFGDVGRNTMLGPGYKSWDFSIFKIFHTSEKTSLEFRSEFFNLPNHTNFLFAMSGPQNGNNATILGTSVFGSLTAARAPRQIQFALKFSF